MKTILLSVIVSAVSFSQAFAVEPEWKPLFDGKTLNGWKVVSKVVSSDAPPAAPTWSVEKGVLKCTGTPNGYLATNDEYTNFELKLSWRYPANLKAGNSGVLLFVQGPETVWPHSIEAQLRSGKAGDLWLNPDANKVYPKLEVDQKQKDLANKEGRHFFRLQTSTEPEKPFGEWNEYTIRCVKGAIRLTINDQLVNVATGGTLTRGKIALQSEGTPIEFRDLLLRTLD